MKAATLMGFVLAVAMALSAVADAQGQVQATNAAAVTAPAVANIQWEWTTNGDNTITITRYSGSTNVVTIPGRINGLPVTSVNKDAFGWNHGRLATVVIPDEVREIEGQMFECCLSLTNIVIGSGVTTIGFFAFSHCQSLSIVTIPDSVTMIEPMAFWQCTSLTNVTIGSGVTNIGSEAFQACFCLREVHLKGNAPILGKDVFDGATDATVYYLEGTKGWGPTFGGRPTAVWKTEGGATTNGAAQ